MSGYENMGEYEEDVAEDEEDDEDELNVINNDEFESASFEEDSRKRMLRIFKTKVPCSSGVVHDRPFYVGQSFKTNKYVQGQIKMLSIHSRRSLRMEKNEKLRVRVKCKGVVPDSSGGPSIVSKVTSMGKQIITKKDSCPFVIQISRSTKEELWLVKTAIDEPLCLQKIKVFRDKSIAKDQLYGEFEKQYSSSRDYYLELQTNNPGTRMKLKVGFKAGQRELLRLEWCFLKGHLRGKILTAVGLDFNNGIYPIAYVAVEAKSKDSWTWFLECRCDDLELDASCNFTFVYDRQKSTFRLFDR
uniref:Transposase MuDR plant domain-containing protein n=1 Tax=Lactuca sativa TaxID=4236 RepID=A0A9R1VP49_LACSA|nr:hypothetical protein LSAT_V11C400204100 [Lactuca sativa]